MFVASFVSVTYVRLSRTPEQLSGVRTLSLTGRPADSRTRHCSRRRGCVCPVRRAIGCKPRATIMLMSARSMQLHRPQSCCSSAGRHASGSRRGVRVCGVLAPAVFRREPDSSVCSPQPPHLHSASRRSAPVVLAAAASGMSMREVCQAAQHLRLTCHLQSLGARTQVIETLMARKDLSDLQAEQALGVSTGRG